MMSGPEQKGELRSGVVIALCTAIGGIVGVLTDNLAVWVAIAIAIAAGAVNSQKSK